MRRVVITGMGVVSPLGLDLATTWAGLVAGRSGIRALAGFDDQPVRIGGVVPDFDQVAALGVRVGRQLDRFAAFAVQAARQAVAQAGLGEGAAPGPDGRARWATVIGSGLGGLATYDHAVAAVDGGRRPNPYTAPGMIANAAAAAVALDNDARGPSLCPVTACASGTDAIGMGADLIRMGRADVVLAGGADAPLTRGLLASFASMRAASARNDDPAGACRPFDADRDGLVAGEGAAAVVLEALDQARPRGAPLLAEVAGYAATNDAHHVASPRADGSAASAAMREAMLEAGVVPEEVGYVNAHATGTRSGDTVEACVIADTLGAGARVSATKGASGHLMGAAGALEAVVCVQVLRTGVIPATRNLEVIDPACAAIDLVRGSSAAADVEVAISNSFGFGGHNAVVVLRRV
ncbi:MAG: beta-ketoacyl-[acyl-carrier-protein] synthase family protein [Actinomycetota bacterium]|nr:beta-ketoacyl-[acyl-carrier-protein] synthase family protein [Actinomycetota bacterium]